jgi:hypothetical protein
MGEGVAILYRFQARIIPTGFQPRLGRDLSYVVKMCGYAVDRLAMATGAHGRLDENPVQRAARDIHAIANHAVNN